MWPASTTSTLGSLGAPSGRRLSRVLSRAPDGYGTWHTLSIPREPRMWVCCTHRPSVAASVAPLALAATPLLCCLHRQEKNTTTRCVRYASAAAGCLRKARRCIFKVRTKCRCPVPSGKTGTSPGPVPHAGWDLVGGLCHLARWEAPHPAPWQHVGHRVMGPGDGLDMEVGPGPLGTPPRRGVGYRAPISSATVLFNEPSVCREPEAGRAGRADGRATHRLFHDLMAQSSWGCVSHRPAFLSPASWGDIS